MRGWIGVAEQSVAPRDRSICITQLSRNRRARPREFQHRLERARFQSEAYRLESRLFINSAINWKTHIGRVRSVIYIFFFYENAIASATSMELSWMAIYIRGDGQCTLFHRPASSSRESREETQMHRATRLSTSFRVAGGRPSNAKSINTWMHRRNSLKTRLSRKSRWTATTFWGTECCKSVIVSLYPISTKHISEWISLTYELHSPQTRERETQAFQIRLEICDGNTWRL